MVSRQGVGNFVRARPPGRRYGIGRYSRSVWGGENPQPLLIAEGARQGRAVDQVTETATVPAPAFVAARLPGIAEGDLVHVRRRVTTIDGIINQSADSYYTLATGERSPDLVVGRGAGGHIARINAISPVLEIQEEIAARMPASPEAARLAIPEGTPVFDGHPHLPHRRRPARRGQVRHQGRHGHLRLPVPRTGLTGNRHEQA